MTPQQRRLRAQLAAHTRWSKPHARMDQAAAARAAMDRSLADEVDPGRVLPEDERAALMRSAARARSAALNAAKARKQVAQTEGLPTAPTAGSPMDPACSNREMETESTVNPSPGGR